MAKANPEIVMDAFRLARTGRYQTAKALRKAIEQMWPDASKDDIDLVMEEMREIARKII